MASSLFSPCHRWHTAEQIDSDDLSFGIALNGGCVLHQRGREAVIGQRGEAVLASAAHPVDVIMGTPTRHIALRLPRAILEARIADLEACNARRIPSNIEGLALLTGYVAAVRLNGLTNPACCGLVVSHVYDLIALLLGAKSDVRRLAEERGARAARLTAVLREIERGSGDPGLSAITIALLLGITPRYVHLLLEETGKSFTHHVLERRLEKAAALLRRYYGATPSDIPEAGRRDA